MNKQKLFYFLIGIILFLAFFLRFYAHDQSPPAPYWEEIAIAYDVYSLVKTGQDHHGNPWPVVAFESFGDWKPSLYFYAALPFIKLMGLSVFAVRLPSLLAGMAIVLGSAQLAYLLAAEMGLKLKRQKLIFLLALFFTAVSPWAISFSRAAWESNLASALMLWAVNFFLIFMRNRTSTKRAYLYFLLSALLLVLASYTYHATRLSAVLLGILFVVYYSFKEKFKVNFRLLLITGILTLILMWPLLKSLSSPVGQQRFQQTSIFSDLSIIEASNHQIEQAGRTTFARLIYHRYLFFAAKISKNFADHFTYDYLFSSGDPNPRHSNQNFGQLYLLDALLLLAFIILIFRRRKQLITYFILFYIFICILPSALTTATPHALRTLAVMPMMMALFALTFSSLIKYLAEISSRRTGRIFLFSFIAIYLLLTARFFSVQIIDYPKLYAHHWQYGYQQLVNEINSYNDGQTKIYLTREQGRPAIYYWFYSQIDPGLVQAAEKTSQHDQGEYIEFQNLEFINDLSSVKVGENVLIAASPEAYAQFELSENNFQLELLSSIKDLNGKVIWQLKRFTLKN